MRSQLKSTKKRQTKEKRKKKGMCGAATQSEKNSREIQFQFSILFFFNLVVSARRFPGRRIAGLAKCQDKKQI
jgi:hypothetical protein